MASPTGVSIKVDLNISPALTKIAALKGSLESLDGDGMNLDIDQDDVDVEGVNVTGDDVDGPDKFSLEGAEIVDEPDMTPAMAVSPVPSGGASPLQESTPEQDAKRFADAFKSTDIEFEDLMDDIDFSELDVDPDNIQNLSELGPAIDEEIQGDRELSNLFKSDSQIDPQVFGSVGTLADDDFQRPSGKKSPSFNLEDLFIKDSLFEDGGSLSGVPMDDIHTPDGRGLREVLHGANITPDDVLTDDGLLDAHALTDQASGLNMNTLRNIPKEELTTGGGRGVFDMFSEGKNRAAAGGSMASVLPDTDMSIGKGQMGDAGAMDQLAGAVKGALPTNMRKWYNLIAFLLPVMITLIGLFLGLAAAIGAVVVAGAGLVGLGLLGHGDRLADSMHHAQLRVKALKRELFDVLQAPMRSFAPIQERMFDMIPGEVTRLTDSLHRLEEFEPIVDLGIRGIIGFIDEAIDRMADFSEEITEIAGGLGSIAGSAILNFLEYVIEFVDESGQQVVQFGNTLKLLMLTLFELSQIFATALTAMRPFFAVVYRIANFISGSLVQSLIAASVVFYLLLTLTGGLSARLLSLAGSLNTASSSWATYKANMAAATKMTVIASNAVKMLGIAIQMLIPVLGSIAALLSLVNSFDQDIGGDMGGDGFAEGGGGPTVNNYNNVNIDGNPDQTDIEAVKDTIHTEDSVSDTRTISPGGGR